MKQPILGLAFALAALLLPATTSADVFGCPPICGLPLSITSDSTSTATVGTPIQIQFTGSPTVSSDSVSFATTSNPSFGTLGTITNDTPTTAIATYIPTSAGTDTIAFDATEFAPADPSTAVNTGSGTIAIIVSAASSTPDTTPPVITPPATQYFATSTFPATPTLTFATAIDDVDGAVQVRQSPTSFSEGTTTVTWTASDTAGNTTTATSTVVINGQVSLSIRDGSTLVGPFTITLPATDTPDVAITPNSGATTTSVYVSARSLLALLESTMSAHASDFSITDIHYYDFGLPYASGLYLNCLAVPASAAADCANWQYTINGIAPGNGAGVATLSNSDTAFLYFGSPRQVSLSTTTISVGDSVTVTTQAYDPSAGTYATTTGVTVGVISIPDASTPWVYTEIATSTVDSNGQAIFTLNATGTYAVGIQDDYYSPTVSLTVIATSSSSTPVAGSNPSSGGGGGGIAHGLFSVPKALAYLGTVQHADGSFDNDLLTDWAALAFSAQDASGMKAKLTTYLTSAKPSLSNVTDYERHAMALEALGINPYTGTATDVITPIVSNLSSAPCDASHIASNIFAIFPLLHAGYSTSDSVIQNSVACIVASQASNGSWNDPDTTAAAIQALSLVNSLPNVTSTITKAQTYLKSQEQSTGSFGSTPSTSWALQAIAALGQTESQWSPSGYYPSDYLATMQQTDGGVEPNSKDAFTRAWATEFAIPGVLGKTWHSLLSTFARPSTSGGGSNSSNTTAATTTAATTTPVVATSTTAIATSTSPVATTTPIVVPLAQTFATVTSAPTPTPTTPSPKPVATQPTPTIAKATTTATTSPSAQVAAAANAASGIDWRWLLYLILGFLALCGLSWLAYSLIVKRG